jgi:FAD/FMN-containing dehydrogenase
MIHCHRQKNQDLFHATIGGLGLTGIITRLAVRLKKRSHCVQVENKSFTALTELLETMKTEGLTSDYQVAWIDLLHQKPRAVLSLAHHCPPMEIIKPKRYSIPYLPCRIIAPWNIKCANHYYYHHKKNNEPRSLTAFNNPLDQMKQWNHLYGPKGLLQFQALFPVEQASAHLDELIKIMRRYDAHPMLSVLKLFTKPGAGLLSFCRPGFSLAIDFINNLKSKQAIIEMNHYISRIEGAIYLAKDLFLSADEYTEMYPKHLLFSQLLKDYNSPMNSDLAQRLGITK